MISVFSQYPTYQVFLAFIFSMALTMIVMPFFIKLLKVRQIGQQVRADGPQGHLVKQGTPTMGGIVILLMMTASIFLVGTPDPPLLLILAATLLTGLLGFIDDISKVAKERSLGLLPYQKMGCAHAHIRELLPYRSQLPGHRAVRDHPLHAVQARPGCSHDRSSLRGWLRDSLALRYFRLPAHGRYGQCREPHRWP